MGFGVWALVISAHARTVPRVVSATVQTVLTVVSATAN
jgi:hypothetical protein